MKRVLRIVIVLLCVAALIAGARLAVKRIQSRLAKAPVVKPQPVVVRTAKIRPAKILETRPYLAQVEPVESSQIAAQITQVVIKMDKDECDFVKKGEIIAQLDDREIKANIEAAQSNVAALKAEIDAIQQQIEANQYMTQSLKDDYDYWRKEWNRDKNLHANGDISASQAEATHTKFLVARGKYLASVAAGRALNADEQRVKAQVVQTEKQIEQLEVKLSYTRIVAPFDGVVSKRFVDPGDLAAPGKPLYQIENTSLYRAAFDIPQDDLTAVKEGTPVEIAFRGGKVRAAISRVFPRLTDARTVRAEVDLKAVPRGTKLGDYVRVRAIIAEKNCAAVAPLSALMKRNGATFVYLVKEGRLALRKVKTGPRDSERVEILDGAQPGEKVACGDYLSLAQLADGLKVRETP